MSLLDQRARETDQADLAILAVVETVRDQQQPATPSAVCALIGGAPYPAIAERLHRLAGLGLLEVDLGHVSLYWVSAMGAELCARELIGWSPSLREQRRRDSMLASAGAGALLL